MIPGWAIAYLVLLALIATGGLAMARRSGTPWWLAALRFCAVAVLAAGVVFFFRREGAGLLYAFLLFVATMLHAQKAVSDAATLKAMQASQGALSPAARVGVALGGLALLPAIAMGALAVWIQQGGPHG